MRWRLVLLLILLISLSACDQGGGDEENNTPEISVQDQIATIEALPITEVALGDTYDGLLEAVPARFTFEGQAENRFYVQVIRLEDGAVGSLSLEIYDPAWTKIADLETGEASYVVTDPIELTEAGVYNLIVAGEVTGIKYRVIMIDTRPQPTPTETPTLTPTATETPTITPTFTPSSTFTIAPPTAAPTLTPAPSGGRINTGESHLGEITTAGEIHRYTVAVNAGDTLGIVVNPDPLSSNAFDPLLQIQSPSGEVVAENDNWREGIPDAYLQHTFETTGVYTLFVSSADQVGIGRYWIAVSDGFTLRDVEQGEAVPNEPNLARLASYGARDVWRITLEAGEIIRVEAQALIPETFNIMIEVVAPDGMSWFNDNASEETTDAALEEIIASVSGEYRIHIAGRNNAYVGDYSLIWESLSDTFTPTPTDTALPSDTPLPTETATPTITRTSPPPSPGADSDTITAEVAAGEVFTHYIDMEAGQSVNIVVIGIEGFDPVLRVSDPADNIIIEVDDVAGATDPRNRLTAEITGIYKIEIYGFEGSGGRFTLSYIIR